jgi:HSP20 family molecular chaperone IbpA
MPLLSRFNTINLTQFLDELYASSTTSWYEPKSKFIRTDDTHGKLEIELPGYSRSEIQVYVEDNILTISAKNADESRKYSNSWTIGENKKVDSVKYEAGLLLINIITILPETPKRVLFKIE